MVPRASVERIMPEDLREARQNHRDAWGPTHVFKRMGTGVLYECEAVGCHTRLVVSNIASGGEDDDE